MFQERKTTNVGIKCLFQSEHVFNMCSLESHDMGVDTMAIDRVKQDVTAGHSVRIYSHAGSPLFGDLYVCMAKIFMAEAAINKADILADPKIDIENCDKIELIDYVADQSVLAVYKDQMGHIGVQTRHAMFDDMAVGPVIWVASPVKKGVTRGALKKRQMLFEPLFDQVKYVADRFNREKPTHRY